MRKRYEISKDEGEKIRERMRTTKEKGSYRRLEAVALLGEGKTPKEVAEITKYNERHIRILGGRYHKEGIEALVEDRRVGGNHRMMSQEESGRFLKQFEERAQSGQIISVGEIAKTLDQETGKTRGSLWTVYYFLHRNDWRKVMPRSKHPKKASDEEISIAKNKIKSGGKSL